MASIVLALLGLALAIDRYLLWRRMVALINHAGFLEREVQLLHELSDSTREAVDQVGGEVERAHYRLDSVAGESEDDDQG